MTAYILIAAACVGSSAYVSKNVTNYSNKKNDQLSVKLEKARHDALVAVCESNVADRITLIRSTKVSARANEAVASDPSSSDKVRSIRRNQAKIEREAIQDLTSRVDPEHGGSVVCEYVK